MESKTAVKIKIEKFEGPLDLLLQLIEQEELDVIDISLVQVTNQYLEYLDQADHIEPANLADFLVIAAQLLLIKSRALLPHLEIDEDEELSADELSFRLQEYKKFRDISEKIKGIYFSRRHSFEQQYFHTGEKVFYSGDNLGSKILVVAFRKLIQVLEKQEKLQEETVQKTVSIREKITMIRTFISKDAKVKFGSLLNNASGKIDMIVTFLALLELIKQQTIKVSQDEQFGNILVEKYEIPENNNSNNNQINDRRDESQE